jgi:hypothetical protein
MASMPDSDADWRVPSLVFYTNNCPTHFSHQYISWASRIIAREQRCSRQNRSASNLWTLSNQRPLLASVHPRDNKGSAKAPEQKPAQKPEKRAATCGSKTFNCPVSTTAKPFDTLCATARCTEHDCCEVRGAMVLPWCLQLVCMPSLTDSSG